MIVRPPYPYTPPLQSTADVEFSIEMPPQIMHPDSAPDATASPDTPAVKSPHAVRHQQQPAGRPSNQTAGRQEGFEDALDEQMDEPETAQHKRQVRVESQREYAEIKSKQFRKKPKAVRDTVSQIRKQCRLEWDYARTHDEDGTVLDTDEYRDMPVFPSPKEGDLLKITEKLETPYTAPQIVGAWKKFVRRPAGFNDMYAIWANFFREFEDCVEGSAS